MKSLVIIFQVLSLICARSVESEEGYEGNFEETNDTESMKRMRRPDLKKFKNIQRLPEAVTDNILESFEDWLVN